MQIVEHLEPTEGEEGQWLGVYITRWRFREWGPPTEMFRDVDLIDVPEVKALVETCRAAQEQIRDDNEGEATYRAIDAGLGVSEWEGFMPSAWHQCRTALAPWKEAPDD